jgi:hypothetical protein
MNEQRVIPRVEHDAEGGEEVLSPCAREEVLRSPVRTDPDEVEERDA